jgi:hypothetical protein
LISGCDEAMLARLKEAQLRYFQELTSGRYEACMENRLRVELAHHWIGLGGASQSIAVS